MYIVRSTPQGEVIVNDEGIIMGLDDIVKICNQQHEQQEAIKEFIEMVDNEELILQDNTGNDGWENGGGRIYTKFKQLITE